MMDDDGNPITDKTAEEYIAVVVGDTVGDPLKDTSGPALNILMKLMAIIALVFSDFFLTIGPEMNCAAKIGSPHQKVHFSGCGLLGYAVPSTCLQYTSWADCRCP